MVRIAVLDDWQGVARNSADWSALAARAELVFFADAFGTEDEAAAALADFDILLTMRERTAFPATLIRRLPKLRMIGITGASVATLDLADQTQPPQALSKNSRRPALRRSLLFFKRRRYLFKYFRQFLFGLVRGDQAQVVYKVVAIRVDSKLSNAVGEIRRIAKGKDGDSRNRNPLERSRNGPCRGLKRGKRRRGMRTGLKPPRLEGSSERRNDTYRNRRISGRRVRRI
jgi:hypothetical protein